MKFDKLYESINNLKRVVSLCEEQEEVLNQANKVEEKFRKAFVKKLVKVIDEVNDHHRDSNDKAPIESAKKLIGLSIDGEQADLILGVTADKAVVYDEKGKIVGEDAEKTAETVKCLDEAVNELIEKLKQMPEVHSVEHVSHKINSEIYDRDGEIKLKLILKIY